MNPRFVLAAVPLLLAGCGWFGDQASAPPPPASPVVSQAPLPPAGVPQPAGSLPPAAPTQVAGPAVDGIYNGRSSLVRSEAPTCPSPTRGLLEVGDRQVVFGYLPDVIFVATILSNGVMHATTNGFVLDGHMQDDGIAFTVSGPACRSVFEFRRLNYF